jgi:hypothetical protein
MDSPATPQNMEREHTSLLKFFTTPGISESCREEAVEFHDRREGTFVLKSITTSLTHLNSREGLGHNAVIQFLVLESDI